MSQVVDSLAYTGLDTLSERALRRLTDGWTGELFTSDEAGAVLNEQEVASTGTFNSIVEGWQRARELYHDADIEAVMGPVSRLAEGVVSGEESVAAAQSDIMAEQMLTASEWWNPAQWTGELYGLLAIVLFLSYIFCLYRYYDDVITLFGSVFRRNVATSGRIGERLRSDIFYGALGKLFLLGTAYVGLLAASAIVRSGEALPGQVLFYMPFVVALMFLVIVLVQNVLLGLVGVVTRSGSDVSALLHIRLSYFALATVLLAPVLLMATLGGVESSALWLKIALLTISLVVFLFVRESVGFFISKKVSILHWILYLCTVEIMPLSLLWQAVIRLR